MATGCLAHAGVASAFPITDPANPGVVTAPAAAPDQADLRNQLQLHNGFAAPAGGGWTFLPRISLQEAFTDNVFQSATDRRYDFITSITPGITILGDSPGAQVTFDYAPSLNWYARTPHESGISQQLLGTGLFTVVPDSIYVDARAVSGVGATNGAFGAFGTYGGVNAAGGVQLGTGPTGGVGAPAALSKQNQTQYSSFSLSPYWLHTFKDIGTARVGYSFTESSFSNVGSAFPLFVPTGGNSQRLTTNEGFATFQTGDYFGRIQDVITADVSNSIGTGNAIPGSNATITSRTSYALYDWVSVFGTVGYENISYGGTGQPHVADEIWNLGTTVIPNPDSSISASYGHQNGFNSFQFNGYYAVTARTTLSAGYTTALQTQLQQIQNELNQGAINVNGTLVNSQTGQPIFLTNPALGVQSGVFETKTFSLTATTTLDRDQFSLNGQYSQYMPVSSVAGTNAISSHATIASLSWTRQINENLSLYSGITYSVGSFSGSGNTQTLGATANLVYQLSETVTGHLLYSFYDQRSSAPGQTIYQNLLVVGISKQF